MTTIHMNWNEMKLGLSPVSKGRELAQRLVIEDVKALLVAEYEVNDCDLQSDYFGTKKTDLVVLAISKHTRNLFSEMRKASKRFPETIDLANAPKEAEHRENYSMGRGNYLKNGFAYSSGWVVHKIQNYGEAWSDDIYISLTKRHCL